MFLLVFLMIFAVTGLNAQPLIIAHRGASYLAPENTVSASRLAWELGAGAVEVDVHLSLDHRVMVIHDKDTKRTCSSKANHVIKNTPSMLLRDLDAGVWKDEKYKGEKIPFLSEIIETIPENGILVVEIKCGSEILPYLRQCIDKSGKADQIVFISFGWGTINDTKKEFPGNRCYWLSSEKAGLERRIREASEAGLAGVNLHFRIIDEEIVKLAVQHGLEVLTWTVDDPQEANRLEALGVKGITTNRPAWLKEQMNK
jgi:glycerophosphoryl diester phosphodiesterase